jgi:hypothetical protein
MWGLGHAWSATCRARRSKEMAREGRGKRSALGVSPYAPMQATPVRRRAPH